MVGKRLQAGSPQAWTIALGAAALLIALAASSPSASAQSRTAQVAIEPRVIEVNRYLERMSISFELGSIIDNSTFGLSGTFGPTPPEQSASTSQGFIGGDLRVPIPFAAQPAGGPGGIVYGLPVIGVNVRSHVGDGGSVTFRIHPAPSTPTVFSLERNWSVTPYVGLPILVQPARELALIVTPRIGPTFENITLALAIDEVGTRSQLSRGTTRTGVTFGLDVDLIPRQLANGSVQPFFGVGGEITAMGSSSLSGVSPFPFSYLGQIDGGVSGSIKARAGLLLLVQPRIVRE